jgi:hypothetical protein
MNACVLPNVIVFDAPTWGLCLVTTFFALAGLVWWIVEQGDDEGR